MSSLPATPKRHVAALFRVALPFVLGFCVLQVFVPRADAFDPWWVQTHVDTQYWSGPDDKAIAFGPVAKDTSLLVIAPQQGPRLFVQDIRTGNVAYVDATAVGPAAPALLKTPVVATPSGPAGLKRTPPKAPDGFSPFWIANFNETELWLGPEEFAASRGLVPQFRRLLVISPEQGGRMKVWLPEADSTGYIDANDIGPIGPSSWLEPHPLKITRPVQLSGRAIGDTAYVRNLPLVADETEIRHLPNNASITILEAGTTPDGTEWYTVGNGSYVRASEVRLPSTPAAYLQGRWIDADLTGPAMVTAYEGDKVVYTAMAIIGTEATPTLRGTYNIIRRVYNETMNSETLGVPREATGGYYLKDVLYTQYFTSGGAALHYNYWLGTFGRPGSHGCLGLNMEDSQWFWEWATIGTPVVVR